MQTLSLDSGLRSSPRRGSQALRRLSCALTLLCLSGGASAFAADPPYEGKWILAATKSQEKLRAKVEITLNHGPETACGTFIELKDRSKKGVTKAASCVFKNTGPDLFEVTMTSKAGEVEKYEFRVEKAGKSAMYTPYKDGQRDVVRSLAFRRP